MRRYTHKWAGPHLHQGWGGETPNRPSECKNDHEWSVGQNRQGPGAAYQSLEECDKEKLATLTRVYAQTKLVHSAIIHGGEKSHSSIVESVCHKQNFNYVT